MKVKIEKLIGADDECFTWMLCTEIDQICCGPVYKTMEEATASAERFVGLFNDSNLTTEVSVEKKIGIFKKGLQLLIGGKS